MEPLSTTFLPDAGKYFNIQRHTIFPLLHRAEQRTVRKFPLIRICHASQDIRVAISVLCQQAFLSNTTTLEVDSEAPMLALNKISHEAFLSYVFLIAFITLGLSSYGLSIKSHQDTR